MTGLTREEMIKLIESGKEPIEVSLEKWYRIQKVCSKNRLGVRHQYDEGQENCALCHIHNNNCDECEIKILYGVHCDESKRNMNSKVYVKDFYSRYMDTGNAQIMLDMLLKFKKSRWVKLLLYLKKLWIKIKQLIKNIWNIIDKAFPYKSAERD